MALQDLTPQLRTRLSRVERAVGWFIIVATLVLVAGFAYYLHHTAESRGWFDTKVKYSTSLNNATGINVGNKVRLMGFDVGEVTEIELNDPTAYYGVTVTFWVKANKKANYYGYVWLDSRVRVAASDFLGNRYLEIVKGQTGAATALTDKAGAVSVLIKPVVDAEFKTLSQQILEKEKQDEKEGKEDSGDYDAHTIAADATNALNKIIREQPARFYTNLSSAEAYWIPPLESPALTERLDALVSTVEVALPNFLKLTNQISGLLTNASSAAAEAKATMANAQTVVSNLNVITANLRDPHGSLGEWLIPTNIHAQLEQTLAKANDTLASAHATLDSADTNLTKLATELDLSLINLANLTSNLNLQVQSNTNLVKNISDAIVHTDSLVEGLKRHWLLRSAFKTKPTNQVDKADKKSPAISPKTK